MIITFADIPTILSEITRVHFKMATHMFRQFGRGVFVHPFVRRQSIRLVSASPRVIFAANKNLQHPFFVGSSLVVRPPAIHLGLRWFADAGAALTRDEIQKRVMDVLKLFDKVNAQLVKFFFLFGSRKCFRSYLVRLVMQLSIGWFSNRTGTSDDDWRERGIAWIPF